MILRNVILDLTLDLSLRRSSNCLTKVGFCNSACLFHTFFFHQKPISICQLRSPCCFFPDHELHLANVTAALSGQWDYLSTHDLFLWI